MMITAETNLGNLVEKVKKFDANKIIVEFKNGYSVAYEQRTQTGEATKLTKGEFIQVGDNKIILSQIIPPLTVLNHNFEWQTKCSLGIDKINSFSEEFWDVIKDYKSPSFEQTGDLDAKTTQLHLEIIAPLEMETFRSKYWGPAIALKCFPLLVVAGIFFGGVPCIESLSAAARERDFYRIKNKSLLKEKSDGKSPAIYAWSGLIGRINLNKINAEFGVSLLFPPDKKYGDVFISLDQSMPAYLCNKNHKRGDGTNGYDWFFKKYGCAKYYLSVDDTLRKELYICVQQRDVEIDSWQNFKDSLTNENQTALLKSLDLI